MDAVPTSVSGSGSRLPLALVVDDEQEICRLVVQVLTDEGFHCLWARDGDEALQLARLHQPDIVLMDVMLPGTDGIQVARALRARQHTADLPILGLSSAVDFLSPYERELFTATLAKPFDLAELVALVRDHYNQQLAV